MATTSDYLTKLQTDKATLVDNLVTKGVSATSDETFTSLVPKVLDIQSGSNIEINDCAYLFYNNARLDSLEEILSLCKNVTNCLYMFFNCTNLTNINLSNFDTSNVTTMQGMFSGCGRLNNLELGEFNTSKVTTMNNMFYNCYSIPSFDLSNFDTTSLTNTAYMFRNTTMTKLIINNSKVFPMTNTSMLQDTPASLKIYVPDNMVETYKSATNWSTYADQIKGMSELEEA